MKIIRVFFIFLVISCSSKWENVPVNEFLSEKKIDTMEYSTYDELFSTRHLHKIKSRNCHENAFMFDILVADMEYVYLEIGDENELDKAIFLKINKHGEIIDSLKINRSSKIINDYIFDNNSYCSWLIDANKDFKPLENIDYFSSTDSTKLKSLIHDINQNNPKFYLKSRYGNFNQLDTCNYFILFKKNKLEKHNFLSTLDLREQLKIPDTITDFFSSRFKELKSIDSNEFFNYDNFYAFSFDKEIRKGISGGSLFSNTGTSRSYCNSYNGTYFITLLNKSKLKLKLMNEQICKSNESYKYSGQTIVYNESYLDFYLIQSDVYHYYIVKK